MACHFHYAGQPSWFPPLIPVIDFKMIHNLWLDYTALFFTSPLAERHTFVSITSNFPAMIAATCGEARISRNFYYRRIKAENCFNKFIQLFVQYKPRTEHHQRKPTGKVRTECNRGLTLIPTFKAFRT